MSLDHLFYFLEKHHSQVNVVLVPVITLMVVGVYALVYATGGIKYVYSHSMYFPIALAALAFGLRGGLLAAIGGGLLLGPLMPLNTSTGEAQDTINWLYRIGFFILIGGLVGIAADTVRSYISSFRWNASHDAMTGLPNMFALESRINELGLSESSGDDSYCLLVASVHNHRDLENSFGFRCVNKVMMQLADIIQRELPRPTKVCRPAGGLGKTWIQRYTHGSQHLTQKPDESRFLPNRYSVIEKTWC